MDAFHTSPRPLDRLLPHSQVVFGVCRVICLRSCLVCPDWQFLREPLIPRVPPNDTVKEGPHVTTLHNRDAALLGAHYNKPHWRCRRGAITPTIAAPNPEYRRQRRRTRADARVGHRKRQVIKAEAFSQRLDRRSARFRGKADTQRQRAQAAVFPSPTVRVVVGTAG